MISKQGNFSFLVQEPQFEYFTNIAVLAEQLLPIDAVSSVINCRRALECAVRWLYSVDRSLKKPWDDKLVTLINTDEFRRLVGNTLYKRADFIRKVGNHAAHNGSGIKEEEALLCLENLHIFLNFIGQCYSTQCKNTRFRQDLVFAPKIDEQNLSSCKKKRTELVKNDELPNPGLDVLMRLNKTVQEELTAKRKELQPKYSADPISVCEYATRKLYIDFMLRDAGWVHGRDWLNEVELKGMPNSSGVGYADYVLYDDRGKPLAIVEAKKTSVGVEKGRQQAELYARLLELKFGVKPVIFLTNGFETRIIDGIYPERRVASIYSKRDLEKMFNLRQMRNSLDHAEVDRDIAGRYYQVGAIKAVCKDFGKKNRRKALLVMATGSGKTRTVIALVKILLNYGWVKNILFLADRTALVKQAFRAFTNLMPNLSLTNLVETKDNPSARCVFSTYNTMMNCIDDTKDKEGNKLYTCGHFDLVICDEAHRSIYNKYKDIFDYFDAPLVGLTATPKDEIDKNTYSIFELENGVPTFGYELDQAVKDGYLVNYNPIETEMKFLSDGIVYDDLSDEEKEEYEETFVDEEGNLPDSIAPTALNEYVFNADTIRKVLDLLMRKGLRVDYGNRIGKTIVFAQNHKHAEKILEIFNKEYPHLVGQATVIDNYINYAQSLIDDFSDENKNPQIAITVDMLDTGIDVPEILNLVFFKKVRSKAKFWQMIGRGTRLCPRLIDGRDKTEFYIFDICSNFAFFRLNDKGKESANQLSIQGALFALKAQIVSKLQDIAYQTPPLKELRERLVQEMMTKARELNQENFAVRQHLQYVLKYSVPEAYIHVSYEDTLIIRDEVAPLIEPETDEISALRFDALMYGLEKCSLSKENQRVNRYISDVKKKAVGLSKVANIPEVAEHLPLIENILNHNYLESAQLDDFEHIRTQLRDLMKYIPISKGYIYDTDFVDEVMSLKEGGAIGFGTHIGPYHERARRYLLEHLEDSSVLSKLHTNQVLTSDDVRELEFILWDKVGTKEEYDSDGNLGISLGVFVRRIVGLDMNAAKEAFAEFLDEARFSPEQIYFVNQIVEYIVHNGLLLDRSVLTHPPFTLRGNFAELYNNDMATIQLIVNTIDKVNKNATCVA